MTIDEMHTAFRTSGQQMGMQLVRGILPESIDVFINAEIGELIQTQLLANAHTVLQDNVNLQSMTMSPINLFRTLYRRDEIPINLRHSNDQGINLIDIPNQQPVFKYVQAISNTGYYKIFIPNKTNVGYSGNNYPVGNLLEPYVDVDRGYIRYGESELGWDKDPINPMLYLGVSIATKDQNFGQHISCRLVGADVLETTLRDYCNGADKNNPIAVLLGESRIIKKDNGVYDKTINAEYFEIYTNTKDFEIDRIYLSYIKYPNLVHWSVNPDERVDCDLPEYIHYKIVEGAVRRFQLAVSNGSISQNNN